MIGCLRTRVRNQPIIALYFESENVLKLYNLEAWTCNWSGVSKPIKLPPYGKMNIPCVILAKRLRLGSATGAMSVNQLNFLPTVNGMFRKSSILENINLIQLTSSTKGERSLA